MGELVNLVGVLHPLVGNGLTGPATILDLSSRQTPNTPEAEPIA